MYATRERKRAERDAGKPLLESGWFVHYSCLTPSQRSGHRCPHRVTAMESMNIIDPTPPGGGPHATLGREWIYIMYYRVALATVLRRQLKASIDTAGTS